MARDVFIVGAKRTPFGKFWGALKGIPAPFLLAPVIRVLVDEAGISPSAIDEVVVGHVLQAGTGQNPARQAGIYAGLPKSTPAVTVNKVCSSSLYALTDAAAHIKAGDSSVVLVGGMENMSRAPYLMERPGKLVGSRTLHQMEPGGAGAGFFSDRFMIDSMVFDGLTDTYEHPSAHMGKLAEACASTYGFSRKGQDDFAFESHVRALAARGTLSFQGHMVPMGELTFDEGVRVPDPQKMAELSPVFKENGTITAGNASQLSDGAAALLVASGSAVKRNGFNPLARIIAYATYSGEPYWYTTAPTDAIEKVLAAARLKVDMIDLFEINEAFAPVPLLAMRTLAIPHEKVNVWGGAIAVGHPIGASGAKIVGTLVHALSHRKGRYGLAVACNGGGEAVAVVIENLQRS